jgi:transposase
LPTPLQRGHVGGYVEAVLAIMKRLEIAPLLERTASPERTRILALIAQRVLAPGSKLFSVRAFGQSTLTEELSLGTPDADDLYAAMDWLIERQDAIEARLAKRHLATGGLALYDLSSSYFEGRTSTLGKRGYSRDHRRGSLQIVYGLLCDRDGRPVAIEVFPGNTTDAQTFPHAVTKMRNRFALESVVVAADRGMVTCSNLAILDEAGIAWITALKAPQVKRLAAKAALPTSLFEQRNLAEIVSDDFPGERLIVCRNTLVATERTRKREELLAATERELQAIAVRVSAGTLRGQAEIGLAVGAVINRFKMKKHFDLQISDDSFAFLRSNERIAQEAALDGIYILRTTTKTEDFPSADVVRSYKQLSSVERAFRTLKGVDLEIRPIHHRIEQRIRAHVLLCMLAYYVEWHLREAWKPLLFADENKPIAADPVAKALRSDEAERKASTQRTESGETVHSFTSLVREMALRVRNTIRIGGTEARFSRDTLPTQLQARAMDLIAQLPITL